jgi:hypothetical protein
MPKSSKKNLNFNVRANIPKKKASISFGASMIQKQIKHKLFKKMFKGPKGIKRVQNRPVKKGRKMKAFKTVTDGISHSRQVFNNSSVTDTFAPRREKLANVNGTTAASLAISQIYLNPGNENLCPIFAKTAKNYSQYKCKKLAISYEVEAYAASSSVVSAGKLILATNFNPDDGLFQTDQQMENYAGSVRTVPYAGCTHDIMRQHQKSSLDTYYVYSSTNQKAPTGEFGKFYDMGTFQFGSQGNASTAEIGELFVYYQFEMIRPLQDDATVNNDLYDHVFESPPASAGASNKMGSSGGVATPSSSGNISDAGNNAFYIQTTGRYLITMNWTASSTTITAAPTMSAGSGITYIPIFGDNTTNTVSLFSQYNASSLCLIDCVVGVAGSSNIVIGGLTGMTGAYFDLVVRQVPPGLSAPRVEALSEMEKLKAQVATLMGNTSVGRMGLCKKLKPFVPFHIEHPGPLRFVKDRNKYPPITYSDEYVLGKTYDLNNLLRPLPTTNNQRVESLLITTPDIPRIGKDFTPSKIEISGKDEVLEECDDTCDDELYNYHDFINNPTFQFALKQCNIKSTDSLFDPVGVDFFKVTDETQLQELKELHETHCSAIHDLGSYLETENAQLRVVCYKVRHVKLAYENLHESVSQIKLQNKN